MANRLREALLDRTITLGGWVQTGHPVCAEIQARLGFDWVCVDLEHGTTDIEAVANVFRALDAFECVPVARLPMNDPIWIRRTLDAGARGLIVPMVNSAEAAEAAVREAKHPPRGVRGYGYSRANMYGIDFRTYVESANDEIAMVMQIEHRDAVENLDAILSVDGVDGVLIGPIDLSSSLGITAQFDHPDFKRALDRFLNVCEQRGMAAGMHIPRPTDESVRAALDQGYTMLALGIDTVFVEEGAKASLRAAGREVS